MSANPYIISSLITASATTFVGTLTWYNARQAHKAVDKVHDVVSGNGKGDVAHMLESMLDWQEKHERQDNRRFKKIQKELKQLAEQPGIHAGMVSTVPGQPRVLGEATSESVSN